MNFTTTNSTYVGNSTCLLVDPDGYPYIVWMYNVMGQCVHSPLEQSSFYVGLASLALYIISGVPQVIENFLKGNADGLSPYTLALFIIGDSSNLLGAILTNQLFTQILLAIYFVTMEIILIGQYIGYKLRDLYRKKKQQHNVGSKDGHNAQVDSSSEDDGEGEDKKTARSNTSMTETPLEEHCQVDFTSTDHHEHQFNEKLSDVFKNSEELELKKTNVHSSPLVSMLVLVMVVALLVVLTSTSTSQPSIAASKPISNHHAHRKILSITEDSVKKDHNSVQFPPQAPDAIIGYVIGFISTTCSIGSRIAQIVKNFSRSSTTGMNPLLFGCSVLGNILYSASIFLFSIDGSFLLYKIPWLTSSLVNICLDSFIIGQYTYYTFIRKNKPTKETVLSKTMADDKSEVQHQQELEDKAIVEKLKALEV